MTARILGTDDDIGFSLFKKEICLCYNQGPKNTLLDILL